MTKKIEPPKRIELKDRYEDYGVSISQLAREYSVTNPTVRSWLVLYGIDRKSQKQASTESNNKRRRIAPSRNVLINLYQNMSIKELEDFFSVGQSTIYEWFDEYGIEKRNLSKACMIGKQKAWAKSIPDKDAFINEYDRVKNLRALENIFDLSGTSIKRLTKEYDVEIHKPWRSVAEIELFEFLSNNTSFEWKHNDRSIINPYELDIVCNEKKLAIEYCGLYWHSEVGGNKDKNYHLNKLQMCKSAGYDLITVFETDDPIVVRSIILNKIGLNERIHARKCRIEPLDSFTANAFNEKNHLHGKHGGSVHLGLFHQNELVICLSMGRSRFNKDIDWECIRMTTKLNTRVVGGATKLFTEFKRRYYPKSIVTFADRRFGDGGVYLKCGFERTNDSPPNYWYFNTKGYVRLQSRVCFQKHKLKSMTSFNDSLTEWEIMRVEKYDRIWDCGNAKYVWYK